MEDLSKKPDAELILAVVDTSCSDSYLELCRRYEKVFYKVCQRYGSVFLHIGVPISDVLDDRDAIILFCIKKFDPSRGAKLSTFIGNYARYLCLKSILAKKHYADFEDDSIKDLIESQQASQDYDSSGQIPSHTLLNEAIGEIKNPIHRKLIQLRYFSSPQPVTWKTIANDMKVSVPTVIDMHGRAIKSLKRHIKTLEVQ